ncbi:hypothetical protein EVAR_59995_1 [Eumeta japonica]|uniref:Uncharacterized protein n=1 Tax=Eumeta variegata TaxID=151549 RepID=A0A4C1ZES6_EUMVA|nr:hypothetical protein EVAR_59995_1 [Eumeta japonica]
MGMFPKSQKVADDQVIIAPSACELHESMFNVYDSGRVIEMNVGETKTNGWSALTEDKRVWTEERKKVKIFGYRSCCLREKLQAHCGNQCSANAINALYVRGVFERYSYSDVAERRHLNEAVATKVGKAVSGRIPDGSGPRRGFDCDNDPPTPEINCRLTRPRGTAATNGGWAVTPIAAAEPRGGNKTRLVVARDLYSGAR